MPKHADLLRLDWAEIKLRALAAGAAALAEAARRRSGTTADMIRHSVTADGRAEVRMHDPGLIRRERGDACLPPAPFLTPEPNDRTTVRAAMIDSLRKDVP